MFQSPQWRDERVNIMHRSFDQRHDDSWSSVKGRTRRRTRGRRRRGRYKDTELGVYLQVQPRLYDSCMNGTSNTVTLLYAFFYLLYNTGTQLTIKSTPSEIYRDSRRSKLLLSVTVHKTIDPYNVPSYMTAHTLRYSICQHVKRRISDFSFPILPQKPLWIGKAELW